MASGAVGFVHADMRRRRSADADHSLRVAGDEEGGGQQLPGRRPTEGGAGVRRDHAVVPGESGCGRERSVQ
uniref:MHC class I antigen n=1 Tax=Plectus sambesii TaxID=2011161 RepID=A0A914VDS2_9BILA